MVTMMGMMIMTGKSYELGQTCVFCMRGILACWIKQSHRLEAWKQNQVAISHE